MITIFTTHSCPKCKRKEAQWKISGVEYRKFIIPDDFTKEQLVKLVGPVHQAPVIISVQRHEDEEN